MSALSLAPDDCNHVLRRFSPMVTRLARQLAVKLPSSVELDDIVQAGLIGLMDAASRYRDDAGAQFETFASQRVRGAMLDELRQYDWAPRSVRRVQRSVDAAVSALEQRLHRAPSEREIAAELGMSVEELRDVSMQSRTSHLLSLDELAPDGETAMGALHEGNGERDDPLARLEDRRAREALVAAIGELPEREQQVMRLYYEQDMNFREIASLLGVTESRVCQIHRQTVGQLRQRVGT